MVRRSLNKPVAKIRNMPVFWIRQLSSSHWVCHECIKSKQKGTIAFEIFVRQAKKINDKKELDELKKLKNFQGIKKYICMDCAENMLDLALARVRICKIHGADAYKLLEDGI